jgi:endonuclease/exonuclease/phosphatase family metal-dependent hydrolase
MKQHRQQQQPVVRIATYNIHKCRGLDRRVRPDRIAEVLRNINADIIALQEVVSREGGRREEDQARFLAEELGYNYAFGENRRYKDGRYGNVVLTRFPIDLNQNYNITSGTREARGCLRADIRVTSDTALHVFNVHFGTAYFEHRQQARMLFEDRILTHDNLQGPRIVMGDFNEWLRGAVSRTLTTHLVAADIRTHLKKSRTYPGVLPMFCLDHIYFDRHLSLEHLHLFRSRTALVASDHLPLVADLRVPAIS